jgi:hypothetical protein
MSHLARVPLRHAVTASVCCGGFIYFNIYIPTENILDPYRKASERFTTKTKLNSMV